MRAREAGRPREALELLTQHLAAEPDAYEAALAAWEVARELGRDAEITASLLRVIRIELRRGLAAAAIDHWLDLVRGGIPERTEASLLIHIALLLREHDHKAEAVRALRFALEHSDERENHVIAMRIARAARGLDPGTSETAAWRALGSIELSLKDRQALESLIGEILATPAARAAWRARAGEQAAPQRRCPARERFPEHGSGSRARGGDRAPRGDRDRDEPPRARRGARGAARARRRGRRDPDAARGRRSSFATSGSRRWRWRRCTGSGRSR